VKTLRKKPAKQESQGVRRRVTPTQLQVLAHAMKDSLRPGFSGLFVEPDGAVVATDGRVAMWVTPKPPSPNDPAMPNLDAVVPKEPPVLTQYFDLRLLAGVILTWHKMLDKKSSAMNLVKLEFYGTLNSGKPMLATLKLPDGGEVRSIIMPCRDGE